VRGHPDGWTDGQEKEDALFVQRRSAVKDRRLEGLKYNTISAAYQEPGSTSSCYTAAYMRLTMSTAYVILQHKPAARLCSYR
jgi:hypothetical protein